ncbi:MAG: UvrD-helicase domain-containing protein [Prevotellaceae bacterium]|nr:UvrD-helicase domain-containing protein [Prevotellaceae bacterium]
MAIDFESQLNESQLAAVTFCDGPSLVIAGAGSGKTRVLTYKVAYLLEHGYEPWAILALTFTNKAAQEMRDRISLLVGERRARYLWMGTFHSIFARILRAEADAVGCDRNFTIYDTQDSQSLIRQIIKERGLDDKRYKPAHVARLISEAKNNMLSAADYARSASALARDQAMRMAEVRNIFSDYDHRLRNSNAMDFDDLLLRTYQLFSRNEEVLRCYQQRFTYVLVDEYQDTNRVQHQIVRLLTEAHQRVCVVGDDAQSIYSFRGAVVDNILSFEHLYPHTRLFKLERNYRSTQTIVAAAGSLIAHNRRQIPKEVYSRKSEGEPIEVLEVWSDREEASLVARRVQMLRRRDGLSWGDFAVLYRTNSQSRTFEEEFRMQGFPYRIVGGMSFYQRAEVKNAVAYLRLAVNLHDEASLARIINVPARGIGATTWARVLHCAAQAGVSPWEVIAEPVRYSLAVNSGMSQRLGRFVGMMEGAHQMAGETDAHQVALRLMRESGLWADVFSGHEMEDVSRQQNLQELMDGIAAFVADATEQEIGVSLTDYLQTISLLSDLDEAGASASEERVTLMTMHAATGLEFPAVFVVGLEEGLFPSEMANEHGGIEEERRLFYVAMTRAEERLFLSWSHSRMRYGSMQHNRRSRFLDEIDSRLTSGQPTAPFAAPVFQPQTATAPKLQPQVSKLRPATSQPSHAATSQASSSSLRVGDLVEHARFGRGRVRELEGTGLDAKAIVDFEAAGERRLLLRFAQLTVLKE